MTLGLALRSAAQRCVVASYCERTTVLPHDATGRSVGLDCDGCVGGKVGPFYAYRSCAFYSVLSPRMATINLLCLRNFVVRARDLKINSNRMRIIIHTYTYYVFNFALYLGPARDVKLASLDVCAQAKINIQCTYTGKKKE